MVASIGSAFLAFCVILTMSPVRGMQVLPSCPASEGRQLPAHIRESIFVHVDVNMKKNPSAEAFSALKSTSTGRLFRDVLPVQCSSSQVTSDSRQG
ncbi:hypothetical protein Y032_0081g1425 [Ancylostoma ceylanicum]|uniref:Uncharacterized protein n=1 Tax=Ancylostoma ceylanicum TaxID=53326 RepID=A0A016TS18_9BILA|nr:hypothetical protein Y032_0081g1425 [Ancylostoma ceylanicum]